MINYVEYLKIPAQVAVAIIAIFFILQVIGEILEFKGKIVPEIIKIRKYFKRKKDERTEQKNILKNMNKLLTEVNNHYSEDKIKKRDEWMVWVNNRAEVYDRTIVEFNKQIADVVQALRDNTRMTEEMFVQSSRDRIIDFATKVGDENIVVSKEEFNRIFKVYNKYEKFLEDHNMTNGEVDVAFHIIEEAYASRLKTHSFLENIRGLDLVE